MKPYKAGQTVACRVDRAENGGYLVTTTYDCLAGFLQTDKELQPGAQIIASFVCIRDGRLILSQSINKHIQASGPNHKRAIDLVMPPVDLRSIHRRRTFKLADRDLMALIADLEASSHTGCLKVTSDKVGSRSALLFYRGRVVGAVYNNRKDNQLLPQVEALTAAVHDMNDPESGAETYDLPAEIVASMAALFMGQPQDHKLGLDAKNYFEQTLKELEKTHTTACLSLVWSKLQSTNFVFVHEGEMIGTFNVEHQLFSKDLSSLFFLFEQEEQGLVLTRVLDEGVKASDESFGYRLSDFCVIGPEAEIDQTKDTFKKFSGRAWDPTVHQSGLVKGPPATSGELVNLNDHVSRQSRSKVTGYRQGQNLLCKINGQEKDGYAVTVVKDNLPGFLKTAYQLKVGDEVMAVFVCVNNGRILLSQLFKAP